MNLNAKNSIGEFPLMMASQSNNIDLVRFLSNYEINFQQVDNDGNSAFLIAAMNDSIDVILFLCEKYPIDLNEQNNDIFFFFFFFF